MKLPKIRLIAFSFLLGFGFPLLALSQSTTQGRGQQSHSIQTVPQNQQNQNMRRGEGLGAHRGSGFNNSNRGLGSTGRWNSGGRDNRNRWNNENRWNEDRWNNNQNWNHDERWNNPDKNRGISHRNRNHREREERNESNRWDQSYGYGYFGGLDYGYSAMPDGAQFGGNPYEAGFADGMNAGQFDRSQGNLYNPRQYERSGNPDYFEGFVAGYEESFRR